MTDVPLGALDPIENIRLLGHAILMIARLIAQAKTEHVERNNVKIPAQIIPQMVPVPRRGRKAVN